VLTAAELALEQSMPAWVVRDKMKTELAYVDTDECDGSHDASQWNGKQLGRLTPAGLRSG